MPLSLEQSVQLHREQMSGSLDAALNWRSKNDRAPELSCLYDALRQSLCIAVSHYDTPQSGIEYLRTECKPMVFDRTLELIRELYLLGESVPPEKMGSPDLFQLVLIVHTSWLIDLSAEAGELAVVCEIADRTSHYQPDNLWRQYARGIAAVARGGGRQFTPKQKKFNGYDRHWATYLPLMADICAGNDLTQAVMEVDRSFSQRNSDKRLTGDGLDGDGLFPVKWDFRKHSLLRASERAAAAAANFG